MSANVEGMVREGIAAAKAGRKDEAYTLLSKAVELDKYHEDAWLWLSGLVESPEEQRICLQNVISVNPANERARKGLAYLDGQQVDFSPPTPKVQPREEIPSSVEWDLGAMPSSSASASAPRDEPSSDVYDQWVTDLNINSDGSSNVFTSDDPFGQGPFVADDNHEPTSQRKAAFSFSQTAPSLRDDIVKSDPFGGIGIEELEDPKKAARDKKREEKKRKTATKEQKKAKKTESQEQIQSPAAEPYEEGSLFGVIPKKIHATRMPGTKENLPIIGVLMLIVFALINLGALGVLIMQLIPIFSPA